jgi:predicted TPR repeat methyltransferase
MPSSTPSPLDPEAAGRRYTRIAARFLAARSPTRGVDYLEQAIARCATRGRALDAGCGAGRPLTRHLVEAGFAVTGIDLSAGMLELARQAVPGAELRRADLRRFDEGERYDLVLAWDSLFHLPYGDQRRTTHHLLSLVAARGVILFTAGGIDDERTSAMHGETFYYSSLARSAYLGILEEDGFELLVVDDDQAPLPHAVFIARRRAGEPAATASAD